jgi:hypothetical protein
MILLELAREAVDEILAPRSRPKDMWLRKLPIIGGGLKNLRSTSRKAVRHTILGHDGRK